MTSGLIVIPARYASSRFPGKPLALLADGLPMIQHVWQNAMRLNHSVVVATDDTRIANTVTGFGGQVCLTRPDHPSGTDRVWEVAAQHPEADWVLNIQGDEPSLKPAHLLPLISGMTHSPADIWTLVTPMQHDPADANRVKVARGHNGQALYFSRSVIPYYRQTDGQPCYWHHVGVYLYTRHALQTWVSLPPSPLEQAEQLEQLRALEHGMRIQTLETDYAGFGVDTPDDLVRLNSAR